MSLTANQTRVLAYLRKHEGKLSVRGMAKELSMGRSTAQSVMISLERRGFVSNGQVVSVIAERAKHG